MLRFIIFPTFDGQIHELLVHNNAPHTTDIKEFYSVHLKIKGARHTSFGDKWLLIESNRPLLERNGTYPATRPTYILIEGKVKNETNWKALIKAIDDFVRKNPER